MSQVSASSEVRSQQPSQRGRKKPHRASLRRDLDRLRISEMLVRGDTLRQIAHQLGVSLSTVRRDCEYLRREWERARIETRDAWVGKHLAIYAQLERAAWQGFESSAQPTRKSIMRSRGLAPVPKNGEKLATPKLILVEQTVREETHAPDPRFLEVLERVSASRAKLLGLNAPSKLAVTDPSGDKEYGDVRERLLQVLEQRAAHFSTPLPQGIQGGGEQPPLPEAIETERQPDGSYDLTGESGSVMPEIVDALILRR